MGLLLWGSFSSGSNVGLMGLATGFLEVGDAPPSVRETFLKQIFIPLCVFRWC